MTVGHLKKILNDYPDNFDIRLSNGEEIIHIVNIGNDLVFSQNKPVGYCNRCGEYVYQEDLIDYEAYCYNCDENIDGFEYTKIEEEIND